MKYFCTMLTAFAVTALMAGCSKPGETGHEGHDHAGHDHAGHDHAAHAPAGETAHAADVEQTLQVGCAGCIYEQEWAKGCQAAVKVGENVLLLKGVDFSAHNNGLCKAEKTAKITGHAEADHFAATQIEIQP